MDTVKQDQSSIKKIQLDLDTADFSPASLIELMPIVSKLNVLSQEIFQRNYQKGWWHDLETGECIINSRNVGEMFMLMVTELGEGYNGYRKNQMDDHLLHRKMVEVELADCIIRILDYCGAKKINIGLVIAEKLEYNLTRPDHKLENRKLPNGKKC